jgi:hypothetical protein
MAFVATAYVWGASAFSVPPIRYEATVAAKAAADAAHQEEGRLSVSVGGDPPLCSPTARGNAANGTLLVHGDELTGDHSSFRKASERSPRSGAMNSTRRFRSNNDRWGDAQPPGGCGTEPYNQSTEFMSDQAAAAHQQWYSDKRGMARMYVQNVSERLTLLELEERKEDGLRLAQLQDPLSTSAASTTLTDEQEMLLQSLRLRMSNCGNADDDGLEDWAFTVDPVTNKRTRKGVMEISRLRAEKELDHQAATIQARMEAVRAARHQKQRHGSAKSSMRQPQVVVLVEAEPDEWYN